MALVKYNNNSISAVTAAASIPSGSMVLLNTNTITSGVSSSSFTSNIDSTYDTYLFKFINIHPATDGANFTFNASIDGGSNYNVVATTTLFQSYHNEADNSSGLGYSTGHDHAQDTGYKKLGIAFNNDNDSCGSGYLHLFEPSSDTFVKHYVGITQEVQDSDYSQAEHFGGYFNTTSAIDGIDFKFSSGNIDSGIIKMYGLSKS